MSSRNGNNSIGAVSGTISISAVDISAVDISAVGIRAVDISAVDIRAVDISAVGISYLAVVPHDRGMHTSKCSCLYTSVKMRTNNRSPSSNESSAIDCNGGQRKITPRAG